MNTSFGRYVLGAAALVVVIGSLALAAVIMRRRWLGDWAGAPARLAEAVIGVALLVGILELLGAVGLFELGPSARVRACRAGRHDPVARPAARGPPAQLPGRRMAGRGGAGVAILAGAAVIAEWGALTVQSYDVGIRGFDSLWYHLPWAASFAQTGSITGLRFTDVEYLTPFYPATAELLHGLGIVLLGRDTLSPGLNLLWLSLTLLAAYCIGRPRGVGGATTIGAALAMGTTMMDYSQAGSAANDVVAVFFLLAAAALLITEPERPAARALAAIAAGLAVGTKLTVLAPVLALTVGVVVIAPRGRRARRPRSCGSAPLILAGGFWYARNLFAVGNPLPWTSLGGALSTPAPPLQQHTGYSVAHYLTSTHFWSAFAKPALAAGLGRWWWAVLAVAIIGPILCLLPGRLGRNSDYPRRFFPSGRPDAGLRGAVLARGLPDHARDRRRPRRRPARVRVQPALPRARAGAVTGGRPARARAVGAAARPAVAACSRSCSRARRAEPAVAVAHALGAVAIAAGVVLLVGTRAHAAARREPRAPSRRSPRSRSPSSSSPARPPATASRATTCAAGTRISRTSPTWRRCGPCSGPCTTSASASSARSAASSHIRWTASTTRTGSCTSRTAGRTDRSRRSPPAREWRAAVNAEHLKYLVTTPARDPWHPAVLSPSPETRWTASDQHATRVFSESAEGQPVVVFRLRGPLDVAKCPQS